MEGDTVQKLTAIRRRVILYVHDVLRKRIFKSYERYGHNSQDDDDGNVVTE